MLERDGDGYIVPEAGSQVKLNTKVYAVGDRAITYTAKRLPPLVWAAKCDRSRTLVSRARIKFQFFSF